MFIRLFTVLSFTFFALSLSGQFSFSPTIEVTAGYSSYTPFEDFSSTEFSREGAITHRGSGNITEAVGMAFLRLGLTNQVGDRWALTPYVEYHYGQGALFTQDYYLFGVSDRNPEAQRYTFGADNSMRMFVTGVDARYQLFAGPTTRFDVGTGLAFSARAHTYRNLLTVDFSTAYTVLSQGGTFITENRTAVGLPLTAALTHQLTPTVTIGIHSRAQFQLGQEDLFWSTGVRLGMSL